MPRRPERGSLALAALAGIAVCLGGSLQDATAAPDAPSTCLLSDAELEASGAVIGEVVVQNLDIFNLDDPEEDKALFRLMNDLHARTKASVIQRQLLFEPGAPFSRRLLDESARILRANGYLQDADVTVLRCDGGKVDVLVSTQDVWTLKPGIWISRSGGQNRFGFDLQEDNFLGRGSSLRYARRVEPERTSSEIGYSDRNLLGRWISLDATLADYSDGYLYEFGLERPFYALDARQAGGGRVYLEKREDPVYSLGDEIGKFRQEIDYFDLYAGWSRGIQRGWVERWRVGFVHDAHAFGNVDESPDTLLIPEDRKLVYPYLGYDLIEDRYLRAQNLDQIRRTEDVYIGVNVGMRLGWLSEALGADRNGAVFSLLASAGHGDPARVLWEFSSHASGRIEGGDLANAILGASTVWYFRQSERRLLFAALRGDVSRDLDLDNPLEIGGDEGLRGYPARYQRGDSRAQFTIEQRYFTDYYLWRLLRVGGAIFFDAGRVWGDNPYGGENLGLLRDVGIGLRLSSTRSSMGRMVHIDLAFPLDGDRSIDNVQFLIEAKRSF